MSAMLHITQALTARAPWPQVRGCKPKAGGAAKAETKTARMLAYLKANGSASAHELADEADIDRACQVSAVLKTHIRRGQVQLVRGRYSLNEQYSVDLQKELAQAAALLRRHGYHVTREGEQ